MNQLTIGLIALTVSFVSAQAATISDGAAKGQANEAPITNPADGAAKGQAAESILTNPADEKTCTDKGGKVLIASNGQKTCSINLNSSRSN